MNNLPRMRTVEKAMAEIKAADPETSLTAKALRRMINNNEIPSANVNTKKLINMDILYAYLNGECTPE